MPLDCRKPPLASRSCVCAVIPSPADTRAMKSRTVREKKKKRVENVLTTDDTKRLCTQPPIVAPCHPSPGIKGAECLWRAGPKPSHPTLVFHPPPPPSSPPPFCSSTLGGPCVCVYVCALCRNTTKKRERERGASPSREAARSFFLFFRAFCLGVEGSGALESRITFSGDDDPDPPRTGGCVCGIQGLGSGSAFANVHTNANAPVPVRSPKLSAFGLA